MSDSIRPANLGAVSGNQTQDFGTKVMQRAQSLRGLTSSGAQMNNTDNFTMLPINMLQEYSNHPFKVNDDEELAELAESIKVNGIISPIIVRKMENGHYEILAGHRRTKAAEKAGLYEVPAKVLNVNDEQAVIIMTDTNLKHREKILPSERAKAYKMQIEAYKCQGKRTDLIKAVQDELNFGTNGTEVNNFGANGTKVESRSIVAELNNTSPLQVSRFLRLNELLPELLELVDLDIIPMRAGVDLSFLTEDEQQILANYIEEGIIKKIDLKTAEELKSISKLGELNKTVIMQMFCKTDSTKPQNTYAVLKTAIKNAMRHFKKTDYQDIEIESDALEQIIVEAIKNYADASK